MRIRRLAIWSGGWCVALAGLIAAFGAGFAPALARSTDRPEEAKSLLGSYLAGRFARTLNDTASAAEFYRDALARNPDSDVLIEQAFLMEVTEGNWTRATELARQLIERQDTHRMALMFLGLTEFKARNYNAADDRFKAASSGPIGELTSAVARAWIRSAQNDADGALQLLDGPAKQAEWAQFYMRYHRALIADLSGRRSEARQNYERLFKTDPRTPRTALAYARQAAHSGDTKLARSVLKEHLDKATTEGHPMARALREQLNAGGARIPLLIASAEDGIAEVFYGLGEALASEGGVSVGAIYLQLALYVRPQFPFALAALANAYETNKRYSDAIAIYDRIPTGTPLDSSIEIRKAINLNLLERPEEAQQLLESLAQRYPDDIRPLDALGSIMRARKRYAEAVDYYTRAIALMPKPEKRHWTYWYARGTSYERLKKWPLAEADLQKALQLHPDQPLVLNYLGYSWIDQNRNLRQGMVLIEKAVAVKPDDGYIVDSLGWAHYKLGNHKEAVRYLERAVELKPEDPVLNDHLGDALWRVGRQREARYQWENALTLKPEPEEIEKITMKLQEGLAEDPIVGEKSKAQKKAKPTSTVEQSRTRGETNLSPVTPSQ
jgi:tetratricopeptide (TPR) repeat protein